MAWKDDSELDDAGTALQLFACTKRIRQGVSKLENLLNAGTDAERARTPHNWMDYEHCKNALGQLVDCTRVRLSESYQAEADQIYEDAHTVVNLPANHDPAVRFARADALVQRADRLYQHIRSEQTMSIRPSIADYYLGGTNVLIGSDVLGHRGGWNRYGGGWVGPTGRPVFPPPGDIYPVLDLSDEDLIGKIIESVLDAEMGEPGMSISIPDSSPVGNPVVVGHRGGHHRGRGWGGGWGWGYPYGPPLDYGYTVVKEDNSLADLALAEAIAKNTELQKKISEREERDWERAREKKAPVVGRGGGHGGGAQGFYRGGWFGGDYPQPFAYVGPYEDVDTALDSSLADAALAEMAQENKTLEQKLEEKAREVGGDFADFDSRAVWLTGKMRGGQGR